MLRQGKNVEKKLISNRLYLSMVTLDNEKCKQKLINIEISHWQQCQWLCVFPVVPMFVKPESLESLNKEKLRALNCSMKMVENSLVTRKINNVIPEEVRQTSL